MKNVLSKGILFSLVIFLFLIIISLLNDPILKIQIHWIAISLLPILIAFIIGGYISEFKGFGIELKTTLNAPVTDIPLSETSISSLIATLPSDIKQGYSHLISLSPEKKRKIKWLIFESGKKHFYTFTAITEYIKKLPNLEYFEIRSQQGDIVCFVPISIFKKDQSKIHQFIHALEKRSVLNDFKDVAIDLIIDSQANLLRALKEMYAEKTDFAAVVSKRKKYLGVIFAKDIEKRILDAVLSISFK
jgi:hypothetical protein